MSLRLSSLLWVVVMLVLAPAGIVQVKSEVRLLDGPVFAPNSGRVEVWDPDTREWLAVCTNEWDLTDGQVVCKELGYPGTALVKTKSEYGNRGQGHSIGGFGCTGDEADLLNCTRDDVKDGPCSANHTAGVVCTAPGYTGCRIGSGSDVFKSLHTFPENTVEKCIERAKTQEDVPTLYAGMRGDECWYGLKDGLANLSAVNDSRCDTACPGNADERCGGLELISLYKVNDTICSDPHFPNGKLHVQPTPGFYYFGTVVNFTCNPGFYLQGAPSVQCFLGSGHAEVMWSNSTPECLDAASTAGVPSTTAAPPSGPGAELDAALVLGILNTVILVLLIIAILIGLYCCIKRQSESSPTFLPRYTKTNSLDEIKPVVIPARPESPAARQSMPQYATVMKDVKHAPGAPRINSAFEIDERKERPKSTLSEPGRYRTSRPQVDDNEEIFGTVIVSPNAIRAGGGRGSQAQPAEEEVWEENQMYDSIENDARYVNTGD